MYREIKVGRQGPSAQFMELPPCTEGWAPAEARSGFQGGPNPCLSRKCSQPWVLGPGPCGLGMGIQPPCCPVGAPSLSLPSKGHPPPPTAPPGVHGETLKGEQCCLVEFGGWGPRDGGTRNSPA